MSAPSVNLVGGQSPWEIVRAYPHITVTPLDGARFEVSCRTPDGIGRPLVDALEVLTAEERRRHVAALAAGREPAGTDDMIPARAMLRLVALVKAATGAEPPAWKMFYDEAHGRGRHPSAQAERIRGRRSGGGR